jgi:hypothetical protein
VAGLASVAITGWQTVWALGLIAVSFGFIYRLLDCFGYQVASVSVAIAAGLVWGQYEGPWISILFWVAIVSIVLFRQRGLRPEALTSPGSRAAQAGDIVVCSNGLAVVTKSDPDRLGLAFLFAPEESVEITARFDGHLAAYDRRTRRQLINRLPFAYLLSGPVLLVAIYQLFLAALSIALLSFILINFGSFSWPGVLLWAGPVPFLIALLNLGALTRSAYLLTWEHFQSLGLRPDGSVDRGQLEALSGLELDQ